METVCAEEQTLFLSENPDRHLYFSTPACRMEMNRQKLEWLAKDLRRGEPRSPEEELANFPSAARCLDKCRATLLGWQGEYAYNCPMDQQFLGAARLDANEFKEFVATGASDEEVAQWITEHAHAAT